MNDYGIEAYWATHTPAERLLKPGEAAAIHAKNEADYKRAIERVRLVRETAAKNEAARQRRIADKQGVIGD